MLLAMVIFLVAIALAVALVASGRRRMAMIEVPVLVVVAASAWVAREVVKNDSYSTIQQLRHARGVADVLLHAAAGLGAAAVLIGVSLAVEHLTRARKRGAGSAIESNRPPS